MRMVGGLWKFWQAPFCSCNQPSSIANVLGRSFSFHCSTSYLAFCHSSRICWLLSADALDLENSVSPPLWPCSCHIHWREVHKTRVIETYYWMEITTLKPMNIKNVRQVRTLIMMYAIDLQYADLLNSVKWSFQLIKFITQPLSYLLTCTPHLLI